VFNDLHLSLNKFPLSFRNKARRRTRSVRNGRFRKRKISMRPKSGGEHGLLASQRNGVGVRGRTICKAELAVDDRCSAVEACSEEGNVILGDLI
jgi:hypothetical protein